MAAGASAEARGPAGAGRAVGVLGLGHMGLPIAERLLGAGFAVHGHSRHPPSGFAAAGGHPCASAAEVADACPTVISVLPSATALMDVTTGDGGLAGTTRRDGVWLEMSTVSASEKGEAAEVLAGRGWRMLDCAISGAAAQLAEGTLILFSSGEACVHEQAHDILRSITPNAYLVGEFGQAVRAKFAAYVLLAGHSLVAAEALAFAAKSGIDPTALVTMMTGSINSSAVLEQRAPHALRSRAADASTGQVEMLARSLTEVRDLGDHVGADLPVLGEVLRQLGRLQAPLGDDLVRDLYQRLAAHRHADQPPQETVDP